MYGDNFALFYDPFGGRVIGGVWNPMLRAPRPHRVLLGFSPMPTQVEGKVSKASGPVVSASVYSFTIPTDKVECCPQ